MASELEVIIVKIPTYLKNKLVLASVDLGQSYSTFVRRAIAEKLDRDFDWTVGPNRPVRREEEEEGEG